MSDGEEELSGYDAIIPQWAVFAIAGAGLVAMVGLLSRVKRSRGKNMTAHIIFAVTAAVLLSPLVPEGFQDIVFSEEGVLVVGTFLPIYESVVAVCTFDESDDSEWLVFWIVNGLLTYGTEFMDIIADHVPFVADHWYEIEFFLTLWLLLPFTDGSTFLYDSLLQPYILPMISPIQPYLENGSKVQTLLMAVVNSGYLGLVWSIFVMMPEEIKRFAVVGLGTVYPILASIVALAGTQKEKSNSEHAVTYWLTYWSCFSVLFVCMDYLENFVGFIPGFYSLILVTTVYLFLPMFQGADVVFRRILVPLTGQYEAMLLRDTLLLKQQMEINIKDDDLCNRIKAKAAQVLQQQAVNKKAD